MKNLHCGPSLSSIFHNSRKNNGQHFCDFCSKAPTLALQSNCGLASEVFLYSVTGNNGVMRSIKYMLQNLQPRVHVSPMSMMVAVAVPLSPPQHSPRLGHLASSHTVLRPSPCSDCLTRWYCGSATMDLPAAGMRGRDRGERGRRARGCDNGKRVRKTGGRL